MDRSASLRHCGRRLRVIREGRVDVERVDLCSRVDLRLTCLQGVVVWVIEGAGEDAAHRGGCFEGVCDEGVHCCYC